LGHGALPRALQEASADESEYDRSAQEKAGPLASEVLCFRQQRRYVARPQVVGQRFDTLGRLLYIPANSGLLLLVQVLTRLA
jgi:hypothetical protein